MINMLHKKLPISIYLLIIFQLSFALCGKASTRYSIDLNLDEERIIPVVFHVLHDDGPENISKAQIEDQLRILNEDFSGTNADTALIPDPFKPLKANCQVVFKLARLDPNGNCTEGIVRIQTPKTYNASNSNGAKKLSNWNSSHYLNIWVVFSVGVPTLGAQGIAYSSLPSQAGTLFDGIVIIHNYVGSIGTGLGNNDRALTSEVAKWLGVPLISQLVNCADDGIDDTPLATNNINYVCYSDFPYNVGVCTPASVNPHGEMFNNFMSTNFDPCQNQFTWGQKDVMTNTLEGTNGSNGARSSLISNQNLINTGTAPTSPTVPCLPIADFTQNRMMICEGDSIQFEDISYNGNITGRTWQFNGGTPSSSNQVSPVITYNNAGSFNTSLGVNSSVGDALRIKQNNVLVSPILPAIPGLINETFADENNFNSNWIVLNPNQSIVKWQRTTTVGYDDTFSARFDNFNSEFTHEIGELISPSFSLSNVQSPITLKFMLAAADLGTISNDRLVVLTSINCGKSWSIRKVLIGNDFNSTGTVTTFFTPQDQTQWKEIKVNINALASNNNVRVKFLYQGGSNRMNNVYIDRIKLDVPTTIGNLASDELFELFPNPASDFIQINCSDKINQAFELSIYNLNGQLVQKTQVIESFSQIPIDLPAGMYFVKAQIGNRIFSKKLVVCSR